MADVELVDRLNTFDVGFWDDEAKAVVFRLSKDKGPLLAVVAKCGEDPIPCNEGNPCNKPV